MVEVKKTTIWLRKKDAEKPIDGRIKNQGVIMIENKIILIEDDKEIRGMINDYLSGEFEVTAFNDGMSAIQKITSYDEYALALIDLHLSCFLLSTKHSCDLYHHRSNQNRNRYCQNNSYTFHQKSAQFTWNVQFYNSN